MSDYERMRIKERMDFGKRKLLLDGGKLGNVGFGFERDKNKKIVINEEESKIVKDIFKIYNYKVVKSYGGVYDRLKNKYKRNVLSISSIGRILRDKKYNGLYEGVLEGENYKIDLNKIIDDELWKKTQEKIKNNKGRWRGNVRDFFELKGKVVCGGCGNKMWVVKNGIYRYYSCNSRLRTMKEKRKDSNLKFECNSILHNNISINNLEKVVWDGLFKVLLDSEDLKNEYKKRFDKSIGSKERFKGVRIHLERKKERIRSEFIKKLEGLIELGIDKDIIEQLNKKYQNDIFEIEKEIKSLRDEEKKRDVKDSLVGYLELLKLDLKNDYKMTRNKSRVKLIDKYIESVIIDRIDRNEYRIYLNMYLKNIGRYENEEIEISENGYFYTLKFKTMEIWRF